MIQALAFNTVAVVPDADIDLRPKAHVRPARGAWSASDLFQIASDYGLFVVGSMIPAASWSMRLSFHAFCL